MATILVVDDEAETRQPLVKLLEHHGYHVITAANAFEAMAAAHRGAPDLMLLDVMIPPMDGLTFLMLLREEPQRRELPVILITGLNDQNTVARAKDLGVKEHLIKSQFGVEELLSMIKKHLPENAN